MPTQEAATGTPVPNVNVVIAPGTLPCAIMSGVIPSAVVSISTMPRRRSPSRRWAR